MSETAYISQAQKATYEPDRAPGIVSDFHGLAESLGYEIDQLTSRLGPVLRPEFGQLAAASEMSVPESVKSDVRNAHDRIARHIAALVELRKALEV